MSIFDTTTTAPIGGNNGATSILHMDRVIPSGPETPGSIDVDALVACTLVVRRELQPTVGRKGRFITQAPINLGTGTAENEDENEDDNDSEKAFSTSWSQNVIGSSSTELDPLVGHPLDVVASLEALRTKRHLSRKLQQEDIEAKRKSLLPKPDQSSKPGGSGDDTTNGEALEAQVLTDIEALVSQVKSGALEMNQVISVENKIIDANNSLLEKNVAKVGEQNKAAKKMSGGGDFMPSSIGAAISGLATNPKAALLGLLSLIYSMLKPFLLLVSIGGCSYFVVMLIFLSPKGGNTTIVQCGSGGGSAGVESLRSGVGGGPAAAMAAAALS